MRKTSIGLAGLALLGSLTGCTPTPLGRAIGTDLALHGVRESMSRNINPRQTHVHVNPPQETQDNFTPHGLFTGTRYVDNGDGEMTKNEIFGLNKRKFDLSREEANFYLSSPGNVAITYSFWNEKGDKLFEETFQGKEGKVHLLNEGMPTTSGKYRINVVSKGGKTYFIDFEIE